MIRVCQTLTIWLTFLSSFFQPSTSSYLRPSVQPTYSKAPLYIGGFFGSPDTEVYATLPNTMQTAVDHVNNLTGILDGYELRIRCGPKVDVDPALALCLLHDFIYTPPTILMAWGPLFSKEAVVVNEVAHVYNLIQLTGANSPTLRDKNRFPLTITMSLDEDLLNQARAAFVKYMGWERIAIVFEDIEYFRENMEDLAEVLMKNEVTVLTVEAVDNADRPEGHISNIQRHDARIIFAGFYEDAAVKFFCEAHNRGLFGSKYVWIVPGWYREYWWQDVSLSDVNCTVTMLHEVLEGYIMISWINIIDNATKINFNGVRPHPSHMPFLYSILNDPSELNIRHHSEAYDSVMLMALAINQSLNSLPDEEGDKGQNHATNETTRILWENAINVDFVGLTGHMDITEDGFRCQDDLLIYAYQNQGTERVRILQYNNESNNYERIGNQEFKWREPYQPVDGVTRQFENVVASWQLRASMFAMAVLGLCLTIVFLFVNVWFRKRKAIKLTSPHLNNLIIGGCVCLYSGVLIIAIDTSELKDRRFVAKCSSVLWLICAGISFAFGSLFMKTYRIRAILKFADAVTKHRKLKLSDSRLIMKVLLLVTVDTVVIWAWVIFGNPRINIIELPSYSLPVVDGREVTIVPIIQYCSLYAEDYYVATIYAMKGLLLIAGVFLAWETRRIAIAELNDSKYIALSVYVVALTFVLVIPLSNLKHTSLEVKVAVIGFCIIAATTTILCLIFLPKIFLLYATQESDIHISLMPKTTRGTQSSPENRMKKIQLELTKKEQILKRLIEEYEQ